MSEDIDAEWTPETLQALPDYPFLPCPICRGIEGCDHTVSERARRAIPQLHLPIRALKDNPQAAPPPAATPPPPPTAQPAVNPQNLQISPRAALTIIQGVAAAVATALVVHGLGWSWEIWIGLTLLAWMIPSGHGANTNA